MDAPLSNLLPGPAEATETMETYSFTLDAENMAWLDGLAKQTGRARSDLLREILRKFRSATAPNPRD
jgi:metal-responsive CopG/Arc/MetJ family transcriptional regulator